MGQLVIVVLSIVLMSIAVAGGVSYLKSDMGARSDIAQRSVSSYRALESAIGAYRVANSGALPRAGQPDNEASQATWRQELEPYLPATDSTPRGMSWTFIKLGSSKVLCLQPIAAASDIQSAGLKIAAESLDGAVLATTCSGASAVDAGGSVLRVAIQNGG